MSSLISIDATEGSSNNSPNNYYMTEPTHVPKSPRRPCSGIQGTCARELCNMQFQTPYAQEKKCVLRTEVYSTSEVSDQIIFLCIGSKLQIFCNTSNVYTPVMQNLGYFCKKHEGGDWECLHFAHMLMKPFPEELKYLPWLFFESMINSSPAI